MTKLIPAVLAASLLTLPALASPAVSGMDLGPSSRIGGTGQTPSYQPVHQGHDHVHATGTVNAIDEAGRKVNLSHGPIPQVGWPAMTMDFAVAPSVDLKAISPGARVDFTLDKGPDGIFLVESLSPAKDGK